MMKSSVFPEDILNQRNGKFFQQSSNKRIINDEEQGVDRKLQRFPPTEIKFKESQKQLISPKDSSTMKFFSDEGKTNFNNNKTNFQEVGKLQFREFSKPSLKSDSNDKKVERNNWREELFDGGSRMWVPTNSTNIPVKSELPVKKISDRTYRVTNGPIPKGTATILYDQSAVMEMFRILGERD